jgi:hypothetical protein
MAVLKPKSYAFQLKSEEAEALYAPQFDIECPLKLHIPSRKIWWVPQNSNGHFPYTLCQECYHLNRFGSKNEDIKELLEPVMLSGIPCNCDGRTIDESYPSVLLNGWKIGVYTSSPKISLLKSHLSTDNKTLRVEMPFSKCTYSLCFYNKPKDSDCEKACAVVYVQSSLSNNEDLTKGKCLYDTWKSLDDEFQITIDKVNVATQPNLIALGHANDLFDNLGAKNILPLEYVDPKENAVVPITNGLRIRLVCCDIDSPYITHEISNLITGLLEHDADIDLKIVFDRNLLSIKNDSDSDSERENTTRDSNGSNSNSSINYDNPDLDNLDVIDI